MDDKSAMLVIESANASISSSQRHCRGSEFFQLDGTVEESHALGVDVSTLERPKDSSGMPAFGARFCVVGRGNLN